MIVSQMFSDISFDCTQRILLRSGGCNKETSFKKL